MARTQADIVQQQLGAKDFEIARLAALVETLQEEVTTIKGKLPIEAAAIHEAKKRSA